MLSTKEVIVRKIRPASLALLLGVVSASCSVQAYTIIGTGVSSCGEWTSVRRNPYSSVQANTDGEWILAFIAGEAYQAGGDPLNGTDADGVWAWIDNYCAIHPLDAQVEAAKAFYKERTGHD